MISSSDILKNDENWQHNHLLIYGFDYHVQKDTKHKIRMQLLSNPKYLKPFRNFVYELSIVNGIQQKLAFEIKIICNEAVLNIIQHSYNNIPDGWIFFEYLFYDTYIELRFRDFGKKYFNPKKMVMKDLSDIRDKGLGLYLITKLSDYHYFKHDENLGMLLIIKKRVS